MSEAAGHWAHCNANDPSGERPCNCGYVDGAKVLKSPTDDHAWVRQERASKLAETAAYDAALEAPVIHDAVNHPKHYTTHPSGVECITVTEHMNFNVGNAVKYLWRCDGKHDALEDLKKARWYVDREISRREGQA